MWLKGFKLVCIFLGFRQKTSCLLMWGRLTLLSAKPTFSLQWLKFSVPFSALPASLSWVRWCRSCLDGTRTSVHLLPRHLSLRPTTGAGSRRRNPQSSGGGCRKLLRSYRNCEKVSWRRLLWKCLWLERRYLKSPIQKCTLKVLLKVVLGVEGCKWSLCVMCI